MFVFVSVSGLLGACVTIPVGRTTDKNLKIMTSLPPPPSIIVHVSILDIWADLQLTKNALTSDVSLKSCLFYFHQLFLYGAKQFTF